MASTTSPTEDLDIAVSSTTAGQSSALIAEDPESSSHHALVSVGLVEDGFDTTYDEVQEDSDWEYNSGPTSDDDTKPTREEDPDDNSVRAPSDDQQSVESWGLPSEPYSAEPAKALGWDDWKPSPAPKAKVLPSWVSPLPHSSTIPEAKRIAVGEETFPFLSAFFFKTRQVDLPFQKRQGLARFLLSCIEQACYLWVKKWHPLYHDLLGIREADELELHWLLCLVTRLNSTHSSPPEAKLPEGYWCTHFVEQIRHIAVHRQEYNTNVIRSVVEYIAGTKNVQLVRDIEKVIETLYALESKDPQYPVPESARVALDSALWLSFTEPTTPIELLSRLAYILEKACLDYATTLMSEAEIGERLDVREPHGNELHHFFCFDRHTGPDPTDYENACVFLRHRVAHRQPKIYSELGWVKEFFSYGKDFAELTLKDFEAVEKIGELSLALPGLEARCIEQNTAMYERSEAELRELAKLAKEQHRQWTTWNYLSYYDYQHIFSGRYEESGKLFEQAAEAKKVKEEGLI